MVVTVISILVVLLILFSFIMDSGLSISFQSLVRIHAAHPSLFLVDLIPVFITALLHPMHHIMNRAIREYEERVLESRQLAQRNTEYAEQLSEGENPEPYEEMMTTDLGKALRLIHLNIKADRRQEREQSWVTEGKDMISRVLREYQEMEELSYQVLKTLNGYIKSTAEFTAEIKNIREEMKNLASLPEYKNALIEHRGYLDRWIEESGDTEAKTLAVDTARE